MFYEKDSNRYFIHGVDSLPFYATIPHRATIGIYLNIYYNIYMPRQPYNERRTRKLTRLGGSLVVSLPVEDVEALKWREKQKVVVTRRGSRLIIEDWKE